MTAIETVGDLWRKKKNLIDAINTKACLSFIYEGLPRRVEPHTLGVSRKGTLTLSAFQTEGGSETGIEIGWKQFTVSHIKDLKALGESFKETRPGYKRGDSRMLKIVAEP